MTPEQRIAFVETARALLTAAAGGPVHFRHQGRTLRGMDCIGLLVWSARAAGIEVTDRTDYGRMPTAARKLAENLTAHFGAPVFGKATPEQLQPGDIIAFDWGSGEAHVGIVGDHPHGVSVIHNHADSRHVIEHRIDATVAARISGVWRP